MRRDVQLFVNKDTEIPASISDVNLLSDNVLNTEDESVFDFENHAAIDDGKAHLTSISGSTFSMSQDSLNMQPSKKYTLKVANLEYGQEKLVINRIFNSEQFDQWSISGITVTPNYTSSPIGDTTADRLVSTANNWRVAKSVTRTSGDENTFSVYAKLDTSTSTTTTRIELYKGVSAVSSSFNLSTGAISGSISDPFMENVGNGWYRIGGSYVSNGSNNIVYIYPSSSYGVAGTMFLWGAQLEDGNTLSPYVKNTSSTEASYEYVNQTEQQISNYITQNDNLSGGSWSNVNLSATDGQLDYLGGFKGTLLDVNVSLSSSYSLKNAIPTNQTGDFVFSYYVKKDDANYISQRVYEFRSVNPKYTQMTVNLNTGVISNLSGTSTVNFTNVEYMSDGWYKVSVGMSSTLTTAFQILVSPKLDNVAWNSANTTAGLPSLYISQLQLQENATQGQYIAAASTNVETSIPNNTIVISDTSDGTGGLNVVHTLTEGTNNLSIPFTTNANTGGIFINSTSEPERTNLVTQSEDLSTTWLKSAGVTLTSGQISPNSDTSAYKVEMTSGASNYLYIGGGINGVKYTISGYFKADSGTNIGFGDGNLSPNSIDLTTEWKRFSFTFTRNGGGLQIDNYFGVSPSQQAKTFYAWGLQMEAGSYPTSYIKTEGSTVTRNASNTSYELSIDQLDLFERVDATTYTTQVSLDLFDFEDINIVDKIKDARDIGKVFTEYSQQFTVPASPKNNELFSHFYNADVISGYDHRLKHEAVIRIGGADYKHGRISLTSSSIRNGVPYSYSIVFYGSTVTLKDLIGDDILPDLENTILDALNLEYSATSVQQLVENGLEFDDNYDLNAAPDYTEKTPDVFVPFISCDSHYFYDSADLPQVKDRVDSRNVKWGSTQTKKGIYYKDLKLAVKIKHVIKAIEQKYGIVFSDDFFNENNTAYSELCLFMHRERGGISKQLESSSDSFTLSELAIMPDNGTAIVSDQYEWRGESGASSNQDTNGWDLDYLSIVDTGRNLQGGYSNPVSYSYKIDFDVEVVGAGEYIVEIIDFSSGSNSSNNYYFIGGGDTSVSHVFNVGTQGSGANSYANYMYVKPRIKITTQSGISEYSIKNFFLTKVKANTAQVVNPDITNPWTPVIYTDPTLYEYDGENAQTLSGSGVGIQAQLPNMKVLDFLTSIFKMFNLTAYLVPKTEVSRYSGQIRVRPLDAFYLGGSEVDITEFVDTSDLIVKRNNIFSSVEYEFAPHKTLAAIKQNERTADTFGSELMNNLSRDLNAPIAFDGGKYNVKANFEKVMYERMTDQSDETTVMDIQWGWMASKDENPVLGKPLLFYPIIEDIYGTTDSSGADAKIDFDGSVYDRNGDLVTSSHTNITRYFRPSNSLRGNLQSLNFGSEFDEWYVWEGAGTNENSLFQNYHKNYLLGIYDKQSRLIDISAYLPVRIVMKLKLEDVVIIKGRKYRINSLKLNITTGESKMELMNDIAYSNINLNEPELILGGSFSNGNLFRVYDPTPNNDAVYKLYVEGVYQMDFNDGRAFLADSELGAGIYDITARKAKYYDNTTFLESEDSNIIEITV